jgi:hypothetical protein
MKVNMKPAAHLVRSALIVFAFIATLSAIPSITSAQKKNLLEISPKITAAKSIYFTDQTGNAAVASKALAELQKWGRFKIANDPKSADLYIVLSAIRYSSDMTLFGHPMSSDDKAPPPEYAYLAVVDPATQESLWSDSTRWGGVLTGINSAGARLVKHLKDQISK